MRSAYAVQDVAPRAVPAAAMNFALESLMACRSEAEPLIRRNWEESALDHDGAPLDVAWDRYEAMERAGVLRLIVARKGGAMVGGAAFLVGNSLHSRGLKLAQCDTIWLAPEHRCGMAGARMLRAVESALAAEGVGKVVVSVKFNGVGALLRRMGYEAAETVYVRRLEGRNG